MKNILLAILAAQLLCSCSTTLAPDGTLVRIIDDKSKYQCRFIAVVSAFDTLGATAGHESENAMNEARNKAAQLGANAIKIIHMQTTFQGTTVTAEALHCDFDSIAGKETDLPVVTDTKSTGQKDLYTELQKLKALKDEGVLSDEEFTKAKQKLLSK